MLIASIFTNLAGVWIFLFIFWKRLKEDYSSDIIFKTGFSILFTVFAAILITFKYTPAYFFWIGFAGALAGLFASVYVLKIRIQETYEAFVVAVLPWLSIVFLKDSAAKSSLSSFLGFLGILIIIFLSYLLDSRYKDFVWYKSGKIGFTGLTVTSIIFITRFALAIFGISMLSFTGKFETIFSGIAFLVSVLMLFILGKNDK